ncbi:MAG TPA: hypothetical protein VGQ38_15315 [Gaiellaceae bacterium]|jgi:hypothetical protein|nr:hypothetical protein [Gaiellaceae bacterium]
MTATTTPPNLPAKQRGEFINHPIADNVLIPQGALVMLDGGYLTNGATATGKKAAGRARKTYDNTGAGHTAGAFDAEAETGVFAWNQTGTTIVRTDRGKIAYIHDNQTVTLDATGASPAGVIEEVDDAGRVYVDTSFEEMATALGVSATGATASSATPQLVGDPAAGAGTSFSRDDHVHGLDSLSCAYQHAGDAAASDTLAEHVFHNMTGKSVKITAAKIVADAAVTADNTNFATLTVKQGDGVGGARSTVATLITNVAGGSWTAFSAKDMGAITNATVPAGGIATLTIAKAAAGVQLPKFRLSLYITTDL